MKRIILIIILITSGYSNVGFCANLMMRYGFEDWSGDADMTPGYIFGTTASTYWSDHENITETLSNCSGGAYEGNYFFRRQFYKGAVDNCLGTRPNTNEARMNIGLGDVAYGNNSKFDVASINTGVFFIRMYVRNNGWTNESVGYGAKYLRLYDNDSSGRAYLHVRPNGSNPVNATYYLYDQESVSFGSGYVCPNLLDGNWHALCWMVEDLGNGKLNVSVWWDNWDATGEPDASRIVTPTNWKLPFSHCQVVANLSGTSASDNMSTDFDKIEVWDGKPTVGTPEPDPEPDPEPLDLVPPMRNTISTWTAVNQAGNDNWYDSGAVWCARVLVEGSSITESTDNVILSFKARNSGSYTITKVSIAERDMTGDVGDIIDDTWTKVSFDGKSEASWATNSITVQQGVTKRSDSIPFNLTAGKDYYVTYLLQSASIYLIAATDYEELYFEGSDHAEDLDWSGNGHSVFAARIHALGSIEIAP